MTPEELLKPRYKVIAGWWDMKPYKVGDIAEAGQHEDLFSPYPHLFKKLEWWEERTKNELPDYIKWNQEHDDERIEKVIRKNIDMARIPQVMFGTDKRHNDLGANYFLPATAEEYNAQQK